MLEMKFLRIICGVKRFDEVGNKGVQEKCSDKKSVDEIAEGDVLKWYGHE